MPEWAIANKAFKVISKEWNYLKTVWLSWKTNVIFLRDLREKTTFLQVGKRNNPSNYDSWPLTSRAAAFSWQGLCLVRNKGFELHRNSTPVIRQHGQSMDASTLTTTSIKAWPVSPHGPGAPWRVQPPSGPAQPPPLAASQLCAGSAAASALPIPDVLATGGSCPLSRMGIIRSSDCCFGYLTKHLWLQSFIFLNKQRKQNKYRFLYVKNWVTLVSCSFWQRISHCPEGCLKAQPVANCSNNAWIWDPLQKNLNKQERTCALRVWDQGGQGSLLSMGTIPCSVWTQQTLGFTLVSDSRCCFTAAVFTAA